MATIESLSSSSVTLHLIASVRRVIQSGGMVALPMETYYGLGVNPFAAQCSAPLKSSHLS